MGAACQGMSQLLGEHAQPCQARAGGGGYGMCGCQRKPLMRIIVKRREALIMASATWSTQHATATLEASPEVFIRICYCIINATSE
jgi:hypothetical protein